MPSSATPLSITFLQHVLTDNGWSQEDLALRSGIHRSTISNHFSGQRAIRDEHLSGYMKALSATQRRALLAAWIRDVLDANVISDIIERSTQRVNEEVLDWFPQIEESDRKMVAWLTTEMAQDPELADMIRSLCRRIGYRS